MITYIIQFDKYNSGNWENFISAYGFNVEFTSFDGAFTVRQILALFLPIQLSVEKVYLRIMDNNGRIL